MEKKLDVNDLMHDLMSDDLDKQISALDLAVNRVNDIVKISIQSIETSKQPIFVAERIVKFGSIVVSYLEEILAKTDNFEKRLAISLALLHFGSQSGLQCLLEAIEKCDEYAPLVSQKLALANISEAAEIIIAKLDKADIANFDLIVALLGSLKTLNISLPPRLERRFSDKDIPWQIRTMLQNNV